MITSSYIGLIQKLKHDLKKTQKIVVYNNMPIVIEKNFIDKIIDKFRR